MFLTINPTIIYCVATTSLAVFKVLRIQQGTVISWNSRKLQGPIANLSWRSQWSAVVSGSGIKTDVPAYLYRLGGWSSFLKSGTQWKPAQAPDPDLLCGTWHIILTFYLRCLPDRGIMQSEKPKLVEHLGGTSRKDYYCTVTQHYDIPFTASNCIM